MPAETLLSAQDAGTTARTATAATIRSVDGRQLDHMTALNMRLEITTKPEGTTPTFDLYLQRATQPSPGDDDWQDFYAFPQITDAAETDVEISLPLVGPQDMDGIIGSASVAVVQESLTADNLIAGHWGEEIRVREVVGGSALSQGCVYNLHAVGR